MLFIAGVANATLFDGDNLIATAQTLVDSSITLNTTFEDIRGGVANKLWGRYAHDSSMDLKITDAMFSLDYLAMNTGADVVIGGDAMKSEQLTAAAGVLTLSAAPQPFFGGNDAYVYYKKVDAVGGFNKIKATSTAITVGPSTDTGVYCVRYMCNNNTASKIVINSAFIPKTLSVILEANLYSGGNCADTSSATLAGKLMIKVPRFMLNGSQEIAMTATGAAQTSLEGSALSVISCESCEAEGYYAEIVQVIENNPIAAIVIEDANRTCTAGSTTPLVVYACPAEGAPVKLANDQFTVATGTGYTYANGVITLASGATSPVSVVVTAFEKTATLNITIA